MEKNVILKEALKDVSTLKKDDITEIKSFKVPPPEVLLTLHLVVLLLEKDPLKKPKRDAFEWKQAQVMMKDSNLFLEEILAFDVTKVSEDVMKEVKEIISSNPNFNVKKVGQISIIAKILCQWVLGMSNYYETQKK